MQASEFTGAHGAPTAGAVAQVKPWFEEIGEAVEMAVRETGVACMKDLSSTSAWGHVDGIKIPRCRNFWGCEIFGHGQIREGHDGQWDGEAMSAQHGRQTRSS